MNIQKIEIEYSLFSLYDIDVSDIRKTPTKSFVTNDYIIDICDNNNFTDVEVRIWNLDKEHYFYFENNLIKCRHTIYFDFIEVEHGLYVDNNAVFFYWKENLLL